MTVTYLQNLAKVYLGILYKVVSLFVFLNAPIYISLCDYILDNSPITIDRRIRSIIYSQNEVFPVILHYGYQTTIEFGEGEVPQTYSVGNTYAWQISVVSNNLLIKPLESNIVTNMFVITNKRKYYFQVESREGNGHLDDEFAYAIRFFYPEENKSFKIKSGSFQVDDSVNVIKPYNFKYLISGNQSNIKPISVFDDGKKTYFEYKDKESKYFQITAFNKSIGKYEPINTDIVASYIVVNKISSSFIVKYNGQSIIIENKS